MMNGQAAADLVLLHVVAPAPAPGPGLEDREPGSAPAAKPFDGSSSRRRHHHHHHHRGPATLLQDAGWKLQHLDFPATKGSRPQLMVFGNLVGQEPESRATAAGGGGGGDGLPPDLCPRHRGCCCCSYRAARQGHTGWGQQEEEEGGERVFQLAQDFQDFRVGEWAGEPGCQCSGPGASSSSSSSSTSSHSPRRLAEETSDAVLVLEGVEHGDAGIRDLDINTCLETEEEESADCQMHPKALGLHLAPAQDSASPGASSRLCPHGSCTPPDLPPGARPSVDSGSSSGSPQQPEDRESLELRKVRVARCSSSPSTTSREGEGDKLPWRLPNKSRKSSLKTRLSKLFRTKSCNGASDAGAKRHSMDMDTSVGCLVEMSKLQEGYDMRSKPRLTRTQSAFTPVSLAPPFTGETVSLVDLDISHRGPSSPHPPTPPPPPRRSLSLLDDIAGPQPASHPVSLAAASLQSLPLPPPPPPHTAIQHSLSFSDTLQRISPQIRPMTVQPQHCLLNRRDSKTFAASLRELEKCGWYWGPMNWDDAEMKLKGKPDGSFLVRDSSDPRYILSLSFRSQGVTHHTRMEHYRGTFSLWCHPKFEDRCQSVVEFIERAIMHSKNGKFLYFLRSRVPGLPPTPVQLLYPVSRFSNVKSLQHLCRFRIRQLVRIDHIPELPLPKPLISYLRKFYYYDPEEETYLSLREARLSITHEQDMDTQT
uniref:suppressor of cytokine signaling 7 n=1 Tax=Pristiophorus japonicus TaxID=55135 RepID=UPI00398EC828